MSTTTSPNMNLPVPVVGEELGPTWATDTNACWSIVDSHTHTSGQGVPITSNAININADLTFNAFNGTNFRSVRFTPQSGTITNPADLGCLYENGVDLYYVDGAGNQVRITQGGSVTGATGTITGLPSGTASASFAAGTFTFQSATNTPATMNIGPVVLGQAVASGKNVTISCSGSQPANYAMTLPLALPSISSSIVSDTSGNLSFVSNVYNVRGSEGGGTVTLTNSDARSQRFNLSAAETLVMPTTAVLKGSVWTISNPNAFTLTIQASDTSQICLSNGTEVVLLALVNTPVASTDWAVESVTAINQNWTNYTLTIGATTTAPTPPGTPTSEARYRRDGSDCIILYNYFQTGSGSDGSGVYLFPLPSGLTVNTSVITPTTTDEGSVVGPAAGATDCTGFSKVYNTTNLALFLFNNTGAGTLANSAGNGRLSVSNMRLSFEARVPINAWKNN